MKPASYQLHPGRIALIYVLVSSAWIAGSDLVVSGLPHSSILSIAKGFLFVAVTALLLCVLLYRTRRQLEEAESEARVTEYRFRKLVEGAPDGIYFRIGERIEYANPAALRYFGASSSDQVEGQPVLLRYPERYHRFLRDKMKLLEESDEAIPPVELQILRMDGTTLDVEWAAVPLRQGPDRGALVFFRDITERKRALEEGRKLEDQFRQAQKMESLGRLAGGIAHDFNNYLTVISGYSELLLQTVAEGDANRASVEQIHTAGERAATLTRQLLTFARRDSSEFLVHDLNEAVGDVRMLARHLLGDHIQVEFDLTADPCPIFAGKGDIAQVLMNLIVNARDAMPDGGSLVVRTRLAAPANGGHGPPSVQLEVEDTGVGMDADTQKRIFEPFFTTKGPGEGTGLGLSTVYSLVQRCEGAVEVSSEVGQGTTFRISLPLNSSRVQEQVRDDALAEDHSLEETVMVVEAKRTLREAVARTLRARGYRVLVAASGAEALRVAEGETGSIPLLLTNVVMPDLTGPDLVRRLRMARPELRVLFISGYGSSEEEGASGLETPSALDALAERVVQALDVGPAGSTGVV